MTTAIKAFRILGTTDDVTECELCGRADLKATVALQPLAPDGSDLGAPVYYGSDCAARAAGWTQKDTDKAIRSADRARAAAVLARRQAIDAAISADPEVQCTRAIRSALIERGNEPGGWWTTSYAFNRTRPEHVAWVAAEAAARARAEAEIPEVR